MPLLFIATIFTTISTSNWSEYSVIVFVWWAREQWSTLLIYLFTSLYCRFCLQNYPCLWENTSLNLTTFGYGEHLLFTVKFRSYKLQHKLCLPACPIFFKLCYKTQHLWHILSNFWNVLITPHSKKKTSKKPTKTPKKPKKNPKITVISGTLVRC